MYVIPRLWLLMLTFFSVFNTSLDTKRLLRSGDVHLNPGPSSNQLPKASQLIANSYKDPWQTHNSGRLHTVYSLQML